MRIPRFNVQLLIIALLGAACREAADTEPAPAADEAMETVGTAEEPGAVAEQQGAGAGKSRDPAADKQAVLDLSDRWIEQMRAASVPGMVGFYADEAVAMPPYQPAVIGVEGLTAYFESFFDQGVDQFQMITDDIAVAGDWAFVRGTYSLRAPFEEGGPSVVQSGNWGSIDRRQPDGSWKIVGNLWNTDAPPPGVPSIQIPRYGAAPVKADPLCVPSLPALDTAFVQAYADGDLADLLAIHADDAIRMPPGMGTVEGKGALAGFFGFFLTSFPTRDIEIRQAGWAVSGDLGASWGTYRFAYTPPQGEAVSGQGKYMGVGHRNENRCWVTDWVIWNGDTPPDVATGT